MRTRSIVARGLFAALLAALAVGSALRSSSLAQPDPATSTCNVVIIPGLCPLPACVGNGIARLCPAGDWDKVEFRLVVRDPAGVPIPGLPVRVGAISGTVKLVTAPGVVGTTNALGEVLLSVRQGSGCGRIGVCAAGVVLCTAAVRSPDVAGGPIPATCPLPCSGPTTVNGADIVNAACGYFVNFGPVGPGNACYDLNCNGVVNGFDVNGGPCPPAGPGVLFHFGHTATLQCALTCP